MHAPVSPAVISVEGLSKTYAGGFQALKSVDLTIRRGEIFALLGPNGAGKTTLISIVCGIVNPTIGSVTVDGHDISQRLPRRARQDRPRAAGTDDRRIRDRCGTRSPSAADCSASGRTRRISRSVLKDLSLWDKTQRQDHDALGRHEAARHDRQGAIARAGDPVSRRADAPASMSSLRKDMWQLVRELRDSRRDHHPYHALHRRSRGNGRPRRHDEQGRADPRRGEDDADA